MKGTGKSSSRKLRRVVYYLLYRMDPQKTHYKISFSAKRYIKNIYKKIKLCFVFYFRPLTPIALRRALLDQAIVWDWWQMEAKVMRSVDTQTDDLLVLWYCDKEGMAWWIKDHDNDNYHDRYHDQ